MKVLIKSAQILDKRSANHLKERNVLIDRGSIIAIDQKHHVADKIIEAKGMQLTIGWFDMQAHFCDPGLESKEDLTSGAHAAAAGGFTGVALLPNTNPVLQTKDAVAYIKAHNQNFLTKLYPMAALTHNTGGEVLTEMIDLHKAGAVAFTDGEKSIWHTATLCNALRYLQKFDGLLIDKPEDKLLTQEGHMHEGIQSTRLGLSGMPSLAEELMVQRSLEALAYTGGRLHFSCISTAKSVDCIRQAKKRGLSVTCDIAAHQAIFDDSVLCNFNTNYKVNPPFRTPSDNKALLYGLQDGTIDVIVSAHRPQSPECKEVPFDDAQFGMIGLQTVLHFLTQYAKTMRWELLIEKITTAPRKLLKLPLPTIKIGEMANLTLFGVKKLWCLDDATNFSKSKNSPLYHQKIQGKVAAVFNAGQHFFDVDGV